MFANTGSANSKQQKKTTTTTTTTNKNELNIKGQINKLANKKQGNKQLHGA